MAKKKTRFQIPETYTVRRVGEILNERPAKMDYEQYRALRREQTKRLKSRLRGFVVWKSKAVVTTEKDGKVSPSENPGEPPHATASPCSGS